MASVDQVAPEQAPASTNGHAGIRVENPATGAGDRHRPGHGRGRGARDGREGARARSPAGRRSASRAAAASCCARRSGSSTTATASSRRSSRRPARPTRTRSSPRSPTAPPRVGFWAKNAEKYLADEKVKSGSLFVKGKKLISRYKPLGVDRRDRAVELPADELLRRLHPGARRRQRGDPQAQRGHAADRRC